MSRRTGRFWLTLIGSLLVAAATGPLQASSLPAGFVDVPVNRPDRMHWDGATGVAFASDGRMLVWERAGRVWLLAGPATRSKPLIDLSDEVTTLGSLGLTGFTLDPQFERNGYLYLFFAVEPQHLAHCNTAVGTPVCSATYRAGEHASRGPTIGRLVRLQLVRPAGAKYFSAATEVNYESRLVLIGETPASVAESSGCIVTDNAHGPGAIAFGNDGTLFAACGDGASASAEDSGSDPNTQYQQALTAGLMTPAENVGAFRAQLVDSLSGKILRLNADTGDGVPSNPFYDPASARAARSRVWILGLHDPQHFAVRPGTGSVQQTDGRPGTLYIGDVGYAAWESLAVANAGATNFGWPLYEGVGSEPTRYASLPVTKEPPTGKGIIRQRPAIDWLHGGDDARWAAVDSSGEPLALTLGTRSPSGAVVTGPLFSGTVSIGGTWHRGGSFPAPFDNCYFHADSGGEWIKAFEFDANDNPLAVNDFLASGGPIRALSTDPQTGALYYVTGQSGSEVRKLTYSATKSSAPLQYMSNLAVASVTAAPAAATWSGGDIGAVGVAGSFTLSGNTITVKGSGADIWAAADAFEFVSQPLTGDGSITARIVSQTDTSAWAKAAVMVRETLSAGSRYTAVGITPSNGAIVQARTTTSATSLGGQVPGVTAPYWVRIVRAGNTFTDSTSPDGVTWTSRGQYTISMAATVFVGLGVTSHANGTLGTAVFDNITVTTPAPPPPDTQAPTVPTGLATSAVTTTSLKLSWIVSTDLPNPGGTGVGGYFVYRNGNTTTPIATVTSGTTFSDTGLTAATAYTYQVAAFDLATPANVSTPSAALSVTTPSVSPPPPTWSHGDIGAVAAAGSFTLSGSTFSVKGSGADIWNTADAFQFVSQPLTGDGSITARVASQTNTYAWAKTGVMFRETLAAGSANTFVGITPSNGAILQARTTAGAGAVGIHGPQVAAPYWVRLTRTGNIFTGYISPNGTAWSSLGQFTVNMASQAFVGLAVTSHANGTLSTVAFDSVQVTIPSATAVVLTPHQAALTLSQTQQFTANAPGGGGVNWSVDGIGGGNATVGTINVTGLYHAPSAAGKHTVTATNAVNPSDSASATVAVTDLKGVYTYHSNLARTGLNSQEYALTPTTVSNGNFGKRWSCPLDGDAWAQPLYVANLTIGGGVHNVVFVATEHDSMYAIDADRPECVTYWHTSFLGTGITPIPTTDNGCNNIPKEVGITGTPVIDPASQTVYMVASTKENGGYFQRLHALNLSTGKEKTGSPVAIQASITNSSGTKVTFAPLWQNQRPGLVLSGGGVLIAWGAHCDNGSWWGWLMRYGASSLAQTAVFNVAPDGTRGGIWMSGSAPAVDSTGSLYFSTGNGTFDDTGGAVPPVAPRIDFGESFLKLDPMSLAVQDFYTPSQEAAWSDADFDISSGGVTVLPDGAGPATHPNTLIGADKQGHLWMIDRTHMERFSSTSDKVVQFLSLAATANCTEADEHCVYVTPAFWNNTVYISMSSGPLLALTLTNGLLPATAQNVVMPSSQSHEIYNYPSPTAMITASPSGNGIAWVLDNRANGSAGVAKGPAILRAYDATNLGTTLYTSSALAADAGGTAVKYTVPVIANGHVYVAGGSQLTVYGLAP